MKTIILIGIAISLLASIFFRLHGDTLKGIDTTLLAILGMLILGFFK